MVVVRFLVGEDETAALVRLNQKLAAHAADLPPGVDGPLRAGTLDRRRADRGRDDQRRPVRRPRPPARRRPAQRRAQGSAERLGSVTSSAAARGRCQVDLDPARLGAAGIDPLRVRDAIASANVRVDLVGHGDRRRDLRPARRARACVGRRPARGRRQLARRSPRACSATWPRCATETRDAASIVTAHDRDRAFPAVTWPWPSGRAPMPSRWPSSSRRSSRRSRARSSRPTSTSTITRNYGETAADKSNELLWHMSWPWSPCRC